MNTTITADQRFEAWLLRETGIDAASLGTHALERAVLERMRASRHDHAPHVGVGTPVPFTQRDETIDEYWSRLNASADERQALIEAIVVPETWFFRDREAFVALARLAHEKLAREPSRVISMLSAPCSTGEEPYSIAMALLDAGIRAEQFSIDAIDISARAIEYARHAVYGRNSFRGHALEFRDRHFSVSAGGWKLNERVQQSVSFAQANLFDLPNSGGARYDFIYCRNVLIYFDRPAQDRAIRLLDAQLADGGAIFVGPAETGLMMRHAMSSTRIPLAFAFRRAGADETAVRLASSFGSKDAVDSKLRTAKRRVATAESANAALRRVSTRVQQPNAGGTRAMHARSTDVASPPQTPAKPVPSLDDVRRLADAGQLDEAGQLAQEFMIVHGPHADAFYLLGLIADARGRSADADDFYRKALYLEPAHYEALTHLAALLDVTGNSISAQQLMRRARRAAQQAPEAHADPMTHSSARHGSRRA